jgi:hypothetical protein
LGDSFGEVAFSGCRTSEDDDGFAHASTINGEAGVCEWAETFTCK